MSHRALTRMSQGVWRYSSCWRSASIGRTTIGTCIGAAYGATLTTSTGRQQRWISNTPYTLSTPPVTPATPATPAQVVENLQSLLSQRALAFPVHSSQIRVLSTPEEFYQTLLELLGNAEKQAVLSSLYLGTGPHEKKLVETLRARMVAKKDLQVHVLLDFLRGTRAVGKDGNESSVSMLRPLLEACEPSCDTSSPASYDRISLNLLHVPPPAPPVISRLRHLMEEHYFTGNKTREARGVHHMKFYVVDDTVIVSGANLSDTYFTNRQDRYMLIKDAALANFYADLVGKVKTLPFCVHVQPDGTVSKKNENSLSRDELRKDVCSKLVPLFIPRSSSSSPHHPSCPTHTKTKTSTPTPDTWLYPTVQFGSLGLTHDSDLTRTLFEIMTHWSESSPQMDVATGYMNLTPIYMRTILKSQHPIRFIAAARDANGWFGASGNGKYVPELYAAAAYELLQSVFYGHLSHLIHLYEWSRPGWSYHAKGLWFTPFDQKHPILTVIGSPNFGSRSVERDTESSLILLTRPGSSIAKQLGKERDELFRSAKETGLLETDEVVKFEPPRTWIQLISKIARPYM